MSGFSYDLAAVRVLWRRDLMRFWRQPSRIVGALGQPVIFWFVIGSGMAASFRLPGATNVSYMEFFFPGVVLMVGVFASIFASVSVIDDRRQGFLQAVLAGPASRGALVWGKCLGSSSVALLQIALFTLLAPLAGFSFARINWPLLLATLAGITMALSALGFAVAWWLDNVQAYHAIQMTLLIPLWVLSGAMFPLDEKQPLFAWIMALNPISYAVTGVRYALYGGHAVPAAAVLPVGPAVALSIVTLFFVGAMGTAVAVCRRR